MTNDQPTILLDFDGVINDAAAMLRRYGELVAKVMARKFGSEPAQWLAAHQTVMKAMVTWSPDIVQSTDRRYSLFYREENRRWIVAMFRFLKRQPPDEMECQLLADRLRFLVPSMIQTPIDGAVDAVRQLQAAGYRLILSSAGCAAHCRGALTALGVLDCFRSIYGADLLDTFKDGPHYYDKLLDLEELEAEQVVVVDDRSRVLSWARDLNLRTVHVTGSQEPWPMADLCITRLAELPEKIATLPMPVGV